jgi:hypothetical protein
LPLRVVTGSKKSADADVLLEAARQKSEDGDLNLVTGANILIMMPRWVYGK